jgi:hypothetical protein
VIARIIACHDLQCARAAHYRFAPERVSTEAPSPGFSNQAVSKPDHASGVAVLVVILILIVAGSFGPVDERG